MNTFSSILDSPLGALTLIASDTHLLAVLWEDDQRHAFPEARPSADHPVLAQAARELAEYFAGTRCTFDVPLAPRGTDFQRSVWNALAAIPYAATTSYAAIAKSVGRPTATRAVGAAIGQNPLSILLPCHRVLSTTGRLTGFAGGLDAKRFLLSLESPPLPLVAAV